MTNGCLKVIIMYVREVTCLYLWVVASVSQHNKSLAQLVRLVQNRVISWRNVSDKILEQKLKNINRAKSKGFTNFVCGALIIKNRVKTISH